MLLSTDDGPPCPNFHFYNGRWNYVEDREAALSNIFAMWSSLDYPFEWDTPAEGKLEGFRYLKHVNVSIESFAFNHVSSS